METLIELSAALKAAFKKKARIFGPPEGGPFQSVT
jgi:hypothetical protein